MTAYEKLFGSPERAAETINRACRRYWDITNSCLLCPIWNPTCDGEHDCNVLDWLKSEEE